jgi:hypothetical protein
MIHNYSDCALKSNWLQCIRGRDIFHIFTYCRTNTIRLQRTKQRDMIHSYSDCAMHSNWLRRIIREIYFSHFSSTAPLKQASYSVWKETAR